MSDPENFSQSATDMGENLAQRGEKLQAQARETWDTVHDQTGKYVESGADYIRQNPLPTFFGALACGFLLGVLTTRRREPTFSERYVEEPVRRSRGALLGMSLAVGTLLRNFFRSASSRASDLAERVGDIDVKEGIEPLSKATRRLRRRASGWF